jgi:outer membrane receptor protein involved in Fe transport
VGAVVKPFNQFSIAIDYYDIAIDNAITTVDGSSAASQNACYASDGTSPYCSLQVRPGGFTNKAASNSATLFYTAAPLNVAKLTTHGVDVEMNYATRVLDRPLTLRFLSSYQPTLRSVAPPAPTTDAAGVSIPQLRLQGMFSYNLTDAIRIDWSTRWRSGLKNVDPLLGYQVAPGSLNVASAAFSNLNISYSFRKGAEAYLNIQNVFDAKPPLYVPVAGTTTASSGVASQGVGFYPADDPIGRYFIVGVRMKF